MTAAWEYRARLPMIAIAAGNFSYMKVSDFAYTTYDPIDSNRNLTFQEGSGFVRATKAVKLRRGVWRLWSSKTNKTDVFISYFHNLTNLVLECTFSSPQADHGILIPKDT